MLACLTLLGFSGVASGEENKLAGEASSIHDAKVLLGRKLFFDKRLSADGAISCAKCHVPEKFFTDGLPLARGVHSRIGSRNTPSLLDVTFQRTLFWEGRRSSLEEQALDPVLNALEHGLVDTQSLIQIIQADQSYVKLFAKAFGVKGESISVPTIASALALYQRKLTTKDSPFDRYFYHGESTALSESAQRGLKLFRTRARCVSCHTIDPQKALFTDHSFHSLGIGFSRIAPKLANHTKRVAQISGRELDILIIANPEIAELGRFVVTKNPQDIGKFKTPSLRNVAFTGPYMHDGSVTTLEEAVELEAYYRSLRSGAPLILTVQEKGDLVAFLQSVTTPIDRSSELFREPEE